MAPTPWWQELFSATPINPFFLSFLLFFPLLSLLLKFLATKNESKCKLNLPPSPPRLPIINHLHLLGPLPHRSLHALAKTYGPLMLLRLGQAPTLVVSSAEAAKEVLKTHDLVFSNRIRGRAAEALLYGCSDVGFAPHGEYWRQMRRICVLELLSNKRVQSFFFIRKEEVEVMIKQFGEAAREGAPVSLGKVFVDTASSVISRCALGKKYEGLEDGKGRFGELSRRAVELMGDFSFKDFFPLLGWMDSVTGLAKRLRETAKGLDAFLDEVIEEHRASKAGDGEPDRRCFVEAVLQLQNEGMLETDLSQENLKAIILDMFVGGTDTVSTVLEWAMVRLMQNQDKMSRAQEEVRRVIGKKPKIEEEDLLQMDYLKCIIKETLRLHAPGPFLFPRELMESVKLLGYDIPPKTRVFINTRAIHRDPEQWENPNEFLPERYINNPIDFKGQDFQFIPFGAGRRGCPGIAFAVAEAEYVLANLLYWFDWKLPSGANGVDYLDLDEVYGLVVHKKVPLQLVPVLHNP